MKKYILTLNGEKIMTIYDAALVCRSKNAGPFQLTVDLMFDSVEMFEKVMKSPRFNVENIAALYGVKPEQTAIKPFERISTIKVVIARTMPSGSALDSDVYGSQQHFPLGTLEI